MASLIESVGSRLPSVASRLRQIIEVVAPRALPLLRFDGGSENVLRVRPLVRIGDSDLVSWALVHESISHYLSGLYYRDLESYQYLSPFRERLDQTIGREVASVLEDRVAEILRRRKWRAKPRIKKGANFELDVLAHRNGVTLVIECKNIRPSYGPSQAIDRDVRRYSKYAKQARDKLGQVNADPAYFAKRLGVPSLGTTLVPMVITGRWNVMVTWPPNSDVDIPLVPLVALEEFLNRLENREVSISDPRCIPIWLSSLPRP